MNCNECKLPITSEYELLMCTACTFPYHYKCLNITSATYRELRPDQIKSWHCPSCLNVTIRRRNDASAREQLTSTTLNDSIMSTDELSTENQDSFLGDTPTNFDRNQVLLQQNNGITIEQIRELMKSELTNNNKNIITDLKASIQSEIASALHFFKKEIVDKNHTTLTLQQETFAEQIKCTDTKIQALEIENQQLKYELEHLKSTFSKIEDVKPNDNQKKFVLYGLDEYYGETESSLFPRINHMFSDILSVEINGFIESAKRLGKKGNRRPVVIELISSRMKKYVLDNARCFNNTGYAVSDILDKTALENRRHLRETLISARNNGKFAVIRNNRLFINGSEYKQTVNPQKPTLNQSKEHNTQQTELESNNNKPFKERCSEDKDINKEPSIINSPEAPEGVARLTAAEINQVGSNTNSTFFRN